MKPEPGPLEAELMGCCDPLHSLVARRVHNLDSLKDKLVRAQTRMLKGEWVGRP
jgi:hypothetical protein